MAADGTIRELQSKLAEHRAQLAQVERLLQMQSGGDDVLAKLRDDLIQVIRLTEELTSTKIAKSAPSEAEKAEKAAAAERASRIPSVGDRVSAKFTDSKWCVCVVVLLKPT